MSAKNRAIGDTEDVFQAALAIYTKAGNKTTAMRRLWNAAYEMGNTAAEAAAPAVLVVNEATVQTARGNLSKRVEEAKKMGFVEGRQAGFEEGRALALTADADTFALSFEAGKTAGLASGMDSGRETEEKRWKDAGHFADGTCRAFDTQITSTIPPVQPPETSTTNPGTFNWANDAESLPTHAVSSTVQQPRDFSGLRSGVTNPFHTLQRRHAQFHTRTRSRRPRQSFHSTQRHSNTRFTPPQLMHQNLAQAPRSMAVAERQLGVLVWFWMMLRECDAWG
ncbi:hypothetical protein GGX14DRAFT_646509 [Mycena pura]|uniref:Uncharacterized protein n=1 Tax=Mycena pura TaxID=153505 RepID=A0AAD6V7K8_9AGAR|nr:hypothetical protein GGX14DRAFT_646509 [Mycena pura]